MQRKQISVGLLSLPLFVGAFCCLDLVEPHILCVIYIVPQGFSEHKVGLAAFGNLVVVLRTRPFHQVLLKSQGAR